MEQTLTELCAGIRNYFTKIKHFGTFEISSGSIQSLDFLKDGQYFRIVGSTFNDGVYQYPVSDLTDESFTGAIWAMAVPPDVIALAEEIKKFNESDAAKPSAYISESFGGYSYSKATNSRGTVATWQDVFAEKMNRYRRIRVE